MLPGMSGFGCPEVGIGEKDRTESLGHPLQGENAGEGSGPGGELVVRNVSPANELQRHEGEVHDGGSALRALWHA